MLKNFKELREKVGSGAPKTVAVACAHDAHTLEAVLRAADEGILRYALVGRKDDQIATAYSLGLRKIGQSTVQPDNAATQGKIAKISHLVEVSNA